MRGVVVQVVDGANAGLSATTDDTGNYAITGISPGSLTLSASITGYEGATERVSISADTRVDFVLAQKTARLARAPARSAARPTARSAADARNRPGHAGLELAPIRWARLASPGR